MNYNHKNPNKPKSDRKSDYTAKQSNTLNEILQNNAFKPALRILIRISKKFPYSIKGRSRIMSENSDIKFNRHSTFISISIDKNCNRVLIF